MLWFILAALTLGVVAALILPLLRKSADAHSARVDYDVVVYRDQLGEIDQELSRGVLTEAQAEAARAEILRRMLAAEDAELKAAPTAAPAPRRVVRLATAALVGVGVVGGAGGLYAALGAPQLPDRPYAQRAKGDAEFADASEAKTLEARLRDQPSAAGYGDLASLYFSARQYDRAAAANRKAIELGANDAATWSALGESEVMKADGQVSPEAMAAFAKALIVDARSERSRFYIGLAEAQIGNLKQAVAIWRDLEKDTPADAPWRPMLKEHITAFSKEGGFDPTSVTPARPAPKMLEASVAAMQGAMQARAGAPSASSALPAPSQPAPSAPPAGDSTSAAVEAASAPDRSAMIHAMVDRLAQRLAREPGTAKDWARLVRAYTVLGDLPARDKALARARVLFAGKGEELKAIEDQARSD